MYNINLTDSLWSKTIQILSKYLPDFVSSKKLYYGEQEKFHLVFNRSCNFQTSQTQFKTLKYLQKNRLFRVCENGAIPGDMDHRLLLWNKAHKSKFHAVLKHLFTYFFFDSMCQGWVLRKGAQENVIRENLILKINLAVFLFSFAFLIVRWKRKEDTKYHKHFYKRLWSIPKRFDVMMRRGTPTKRCRIIAV